MDYLRHNTLENFTVPYSNSMLRLPEISPSKEDYSTFENRLKTYTDWPQDVGVLKEDLARAGFIYTGDDDTVICPSCKTEGYHWASGDDPMTDHRSWNPNCLFVRKLARNQNAESTENTRGVDTTGLYGIESLPNCISRDAETSKNLGIQTWKGAHTPDKSTYDSRLATFVNWPKSLKQKPTELAEAGFYYTDTGDQTLCFHCNGGLRDWEEDDDPWEQHALWFGNCAFVNLKKGKEYIEEVRRKHKPEFSISGSSEIQTKQPNIILEQTRNTKEEKTLKTEIESEVTEKTLCKICFKNEVGVVFLPCGHIVACADCAAALKNCAVCRKPLQASVRAFLS